VCYCTRKENTYLEWFTECLCLRVTTFKAFSKKSELMLIRRATVSVQFNFIRWLSCSSSSNFGENSLFKCASQPKIEKNSLKPAAFLFQCRSRSSVLVPPESSSAVLVMISSKSVSICSLSCARLVDSSRNHPFSGGTQI